MRDEPPDASQYVRPDDLTGHATKQDNQECNKDHDMKCYLYNISRHLNPIVVPEIMRNPPRDPRDPFNPLKTMEQTGFGGSLTLRPVVIRKVKQWYAKK